MLTRSVRAKKTAHFLVLLHISNFCFMFIDTPDGPNSNSTGGGASSTRRRGTVRNRYGNARLRAATMGVPLESLASRSARRATLSPSPVLPPPGLLSDEELARRLQEEEWEAASVMSGEDDLDGGMLRSLESPLHLFGAGYHRRRVSRPRDQSFAVSCLNNVYRLAKLISADTFHKVWVACCYVQLSDALVIYLRISDLPLIPI